MPELLFLLLPIAALYGYVIGRNSFKQAQLRQHEEINQNFLSGLNLFLNNQRDKAIEVLIENLEVNNETFTTHIALGKLFRAKGENDRAIKIHQFLAKQDALSPSQRKTSILQLAKDFIDSALYDRAEALLKPLVDDNDLDYEARTLLSRIYQTYRDWLPAYEIIKGLEPQEGDNLDNVRAYLLCELAEKQQGQEKQQSLLQALSYDSRCARAYLALIAFSLEGEQLDKAQKYAHDLVEQAVDFVSLVVPKLDDIFPCKTEQLKFLQRTEKLSTSSTAIADKIAKLQLENNNASAARKTLVNMLEGHATIRGFASLMDVNASQVDSEHARSMMKSLQSMVVKKIEQLPDFECDQCGYQGSFLFWQCPRCKNWGSVKPIKGLTGD
ncbi:hypothetical protein C2869_05640 [Saccharobesus litoralis]|uniref:LapB rubredoxin metal binding domain-containing protein n=1 Tax=Saccharobesus litoralis TaxID=2172099 RepID=A0A2S0VP26_9ALTE|nr:hypothetical protein [Saccharobesus litoralis]AWB65954.1 hypothetical protein C2869_05640 [Saccharobesus litoralis]